MRNSKDKIPEKDILKKRITTTTTTPSSVKKSASGTSLLLKPTARNTATDKLQRTVEEANNNADQPMQEDQHSTPSVNDDPALDNTGAPLVSQMSFSPSANTPEWVFHFQREFRAHEQRIASLEYAMAEIDRLKSELDATKTELASANAQVASLQKQLLVRTDSGSNASQYASLPPTIQATNGRAPSLSPAEFPALPASNTKSASSSPKNATSYQPVKKCKKESIKSILRMFEAPRVVDPSILEDPQYRYFHFACKYRKKLAKYRSQLRRLGLDTGRILDIHYPAKGIVALLIHQEYSTDFLATLAKHKLEPITDFDQFAAANLNDPALLTLDDAARAAKARELQQARLARGIQHARQYLRSAIARDFQRQGFLSSEQVETILRGGSISTSVNTDMDTQGFESSAASSSSSPVFATGAAASSLAGAVFESASLSSSLPPSSPAPPALTLTTWNANGLVRQTVNTVTDYLSDSSLIFITETWLLPPLRFPTTWQQFHTYGKRVSGDPHHTHRGQQGITLLVNPNCPYPVMPLPSRSPYVFSCRVSKYLIHCLYLPPSLSDQEVAALFEGPDALEQDANTILCGDFNARSQALLGDTATYTRGSWLHEFILSNGLHCWNALLAYGIPTLSSPSRLDNAQVGHTSWNSIVDLIISYSPLLEPTMTIHDANLGSDHVPVSLSFVPTTAPPPAAPHPRLLWKLSLLDDHKSVEHYRALFRVEISPIKTALLAEVKYTLEMLNHNHSTSTHANSSNISRPHPPDVDMLADSLTRAIHTSLDKSVGRQKPPAGPRGNARFWTDSLQHLVELREDARRAWKRAPEGVGKALLWKEYLAAGKSFAKAVKSRRNETWKEFCDKLSNGSFADTAATIKRIRRNRAITPGFTHVEGPAAAARTMANHLRNVFAGNCLPAQRPSAPSLPDGPCVTDHDRLYLCKTFDLVDCPGVSYPISPVVMADSISATDCPFTIGCIAFMLQRKLACRKAPGVDHLRAEMLIIPLIEDLAPVLCLLFSLCWMWSRVPVDWCTAQVVPIFKGKGNPLDPASYRPISLCSVLRKLMELCLYPDLLATAPELDPVQGGFRENRSTLDSALALHELCRQHTVDHHGEPPVLCFLDIKQAYDTVHRPVIWRTLETHVSDPMLGILQSLFDNVKIETLVSGARSPSFWPSTAVLQGSILSPFLYSHYINTLPALLRTISMPSSRSFDSFPQRKYNSLWLNSLLYADDVVLIGTAETMPRLLKKAEEHSHLLGYRWNPAKCIVLNPPMYTGRTSPLRLYGSPLPAADSFNYLGLPFNTKAQLDAGMLVQRNIQSALVTMRTSIQPLGFHSPSFYRLTAAKIYGTFIRPKLEYGLSISKLLVKHTKSLEKAQDICLRLLFRGKAAASTQVYKHLTALPHIHERVAILAFKTITRTTQLPSDTLLGSLLPHIESSRKDVKFRWPMLLTQSSLWKFICHPPGSDPDAAPAYTCIMDWLNSPTGNNVKAVISQFRHQNLTSTLNHQTPPVLLSSCRPRIGVDPILFLPMDNWLRSRICRWKMGWLPARPVPCQCGHPHASRQHLLSCLSVADRLNVPHDAQPNPLDYVLNQLPNIKKPPSTSSQHQQVYLRWSSWWPVVCQILFEMETICLPDEEFSLAASDTQGLAFLEWLLPVYYKQMAPIVRSSLYDWI